MGRTELHYTTGEDFSCSAVFDKAIAEDSRTIGVCNYMSVGEYPRLASLARSHFPNIRVVYGVEVSYLPQDETTPAKMTLLAKNLDGIRAINEILSSRQTVDGQSLCRYDTINQNRNNLLCGASGCESELFFAIKRNSSLKGVEKTAVKFDYFEIAPDSDEENCEIYRKIYLLGQTVGVLVTATDGKGGRLDTQELAEALTYLTSEEKDDALIYAANELCSHIDNIMFI